MYDGFLREIDYLRLSITSRCNLFCNYCRSKEACEISKTELKTEDIIKIISVFHKLGIKKLRLTGGEPLLREDIFEIIDFSAKIGIDDINITTNGVFDDFIINKLIESKVFSINISLDTLDKKRYFELTSVDALDIVKNTIKKLSILKKVKVNTVLMKTVNFDKIEELIEFSKENNVLIRFIELMPIGVANNIFEKEFIGIDDVLKRFSRYEKVTFNKKSVATYYYIHDFDHIVGFISAVSSCFCNECNKVRVSSDGVLYNCLFDQKGLDLKDYLNSEDAMVLKIKEFILGKSYKRNNTTESMMFRIGG